MDYDLRNRASSPYDSQSPMYRQSTVSSAPSSHPMYGQSLYPRVGQPGHNVFPPVGRHPSYHQASPPSLSSSGLGIRVALKPEYCISLPPQLSPQVGDIPRSNFWFDFELERKVLAEAEKESQNWSKFVPENLPSRTPETEREPSVGSTADPVMSRYIASGLNREAVRIAVAKYGDNPTKVQEFVKGYTLLREMGFSSNNVAEALLMYDNDTDKALAHFLDSS